MPKRIIISVSSDIVTDQRVLKVAGYLREKGNEIIIVGRRLPHSLPADNLPFRVTRFKMIFRKGMLFYKFFNIRLFFFLLFQKADILLSNDLDTLLPNWLVSRLKKRQLIYDAHEYFTGVPELAGRGFAYRVWKFIERITIPEIRHMMTVNDSIAGLYRKEYGVDPVVVRNLPGKIDIVPRSRSEFGVKDSDTLLVLQGTGINQGRGGVQLIEAVSSMQGIHLFIIGRGTALGEMKELTEKLKLRSMITFLPVMPWEEMMRITSMADVGMSLDSGDSLNYYYSLPNKIFDYLNAGVAIIATDLPEISAIIKENNCGLVIPGNEPALIAEAIIQLETNRDLLKQFKDNSRKASAKYSWDNETERIKDVYIKAGVDIS